VNRPIEYYLREYIKERGVAISVIAKRTGIPDKALYNSLGKSRKLRGDELLLICNFLKVEPLSLLK